MRWVCACTGFVLIRFLCQQLLSGGHGGYRQCSAPRKEKDIAMYANKALSVKRWPSIQGLKQGCSKLGFS